MNRIHPASAPALEEQIIWLTGASSGIGAALAEALKSRCAGLVLTSRNREALEKLAQGQSNILIAPADITDRRQMHQAGVFIQSRFGRVDTLIANAGTCEYLDVREFDVALIKRVFDTNFNGLIHTLEVALPLIRKSRRGYLVGMGSSATYLPLPRAEAYGGSKAAVSYLMESLRGDLAAEQIDVSIISPGFVKTPLTDRNDFPMPMRITPEQAATSIIRGLERRPWEIHFPRRFTLMLKLLSALPASLRLKITSKIAAKHSSESPLPGQTELQSTTQSRAERDAS